MPATIEQLGEINGLRLVTVRGDSSYVTGGYSVPSGPLGIVIPLGLSSAPADYLGVWDTRTRKLRVITTLSGPSDVGLEVPAATDLSGASFRCLIG